MPKTLLEVSRLSKKFDKQHGIENISFSLKSGEVVGFIGPSGSGKTTTLKCLLNLLRKDEGEIRFFGKDLRKYYTDIMQFTSYLPSEPLKYDKMTVEKFLKYANSFYEIDYSENIFKLLIQFDLEGNRRICDLSLGEQKKVAIINAFFHEPKILLLDEPTESLDPLMQIEFFRLVTERKNAGATILFTSHQLNNISNFCDRVIIIKKGLISYDMPVSDLKQIHKRISFTTQKEIQDKLTSLEGVKNLQIKEDRATFLYVGNINPLLKRLASFELEDVLIENPSIEELFLHYYDK